jgi:hypothetical protein
MYPLRTKVNAGFTRWSSGYLTASSKTCWTQGEQNGFEDCLVEITKTAIAISEADKGNLQLFDASSGSLTIVAQQGFEEDFLKFFDSVSKNEAACGAAVGTAKQIIVDDVLTSEIFVRQPAQKVLVDAGVRAVVSTPLLSSKERPLGVLSTHFARPRQCLPILVVDWLRKPCGSCRPSRTLELSRGMSALCQKRTFCTAVKTSLFDHLVGEDEQLVCNIELNQLCCFAMDHQLELNRLLNWHIGYRPGH